MRLYLGSARVVATRREGAVTVFLVPSIKRRYCLGLGVVANGGVWVGNGSEGVSVLWGAAKRRLDRWHRNSFALSGKRIGLFAGDCF